VRFVSGGIQRLRRGVVVAAVVLAAGCSVGGGIDVELPQPPPTRATTTTTRPPGYGSVVLVSVPGRTTLPPLTTVPGPSALGGVVRGPDGPVAGATVRVERLVDTRSVATDVLSGLDGTWQLTGIQGGRYRVRAWRAPDLAGRPTVLFLEAARPATLELRLERRDGVAVTAAIAPDPPPVGSPANLSVVVAQRSVDDQGIVRAVPLAGVAVELLALGSWTVRPPTATTTDAGGRAGWQVVCRAAGDQELAVSVAGELVILPIAACVEPPPPTTEPTTTSAATSTTLRARGRPVPPTTG
jgi:hypothetical protein